MILKKPTILHNVLIICIVFICMCLLFPITESLSKGLGETFFEAIFDIPTQLRIGIDITITVISVLSIIRFA